MNNFVLVLVSVSIIGLLLAINISWSSKILISMLLFGMIVQLSSDVQQPVPLPVQRPIQRPMPRPALPNTGQSSVSSAAFALTHVPAAPPVSDIDAQIRREGLKKAPPKDAKRPPLYQRMEAAECCPTFFRRP